MLPRGFRGPGFFVDQTRCFVSWPIGAISTMQRLSEHSQSAEPRLLLQDDEAEQRRTGAARRIVWDAGGGVGSRISPSHGRWEARAELTEVPVTTFPGLRTPIHLSYLTYLGGKALPVASAAYFRTALTLCRLTGNPPSMLLHPLDFLGSEDDDGIPRFFPGMDLFSGRKLELAHHFLDQLQDTFELAPIDDYVRELPTTKGRVQNKPF